MITSGTVTLLMVVVQAACAGTAGSRTPSGAPPSSAPMARILIMWFSRHRTIGASRALRSRSIGDTGGSHRHSATRTRIRTVPFEAGTRRMEAHKAVQLAMAEIVKALHRGRG